jgi:uncharacterized membrane protein (DUF373 family)
MTTPKGAQSETRNWIARGFSAVEDIVYLGLGLLLGALVIALLTQAFIDFGRSVWSLSVGKEVIRLLDQALLILLIVEVLYTVQVAFREHAVAPEPFILVGLISVIRRVLVLTAEVGELDDRGGEALQPFIHELAVLAVLIVALSGALWFLSRNKQKVVAERA